MAWLKRTCPINDPFQLISLYEHAQWCAPINVPFPLTLQCKPGVQCTVYLITICMSCNSI